MKLCKKKNFFGLQTNVALKILYWIIIKNAKVDGKMMMKENIKEAIFLKYNLHLILYPIEL